MIRCTPSEARTKLTFRYQSPEGTSLDRGVTPTYIVRQVQISVLAHRENSSTMDLCKNVVAIGMSGILGRKFSMGKTTEHVLV
jgi:hypothetical protein